MSTKDEKIDQPQPMVAQRTVAAVPIRSSDDAWEAVTGLITETLEARGYPHLDKVDAALDNIHPLSNYFLTMHLLEGGVIEFDMEDLLLAFAPVYGLTEADEDLSLPPVEVLGPMSPETKLTLTFSLTRSVEDPFVQELVERVNAEGVITVKIATLEPDPFPPDDLTDELAEETHTRQSHSKEADHHGGNH